jgi:hypothetical protein
MTGRNIDPHANALAVEIIDAAIERARARGSLHDPSFVRFIELALAKAEDPTALIRWMAAHASALAMSPLPWEEYRTLVIGDRLLRDAQEGQDDE